MTQTSKFSDPPEPLLISIKDAAKLVGLSEWSVEDLLRRGIYRAKKAGRRTLIEFASVKAHTAALPSAKFAPPRERRQRVRASCMNARAPTAAETDAGTKV